MIQLNALRMALEEWQKSATDEEKARARTRIKELVTPGLVRDILARIDDLECRDNND
jgi:hypothetical protein